MKYSNWKGYIIKKCSEANDFSHLDDSLFPFKDESQDSIIRDFYDGAVIPEYYNLSLDERRYVMCQKFTETPLNAVKKYFDVAPICIKKYERMHIDDISFFVEPNNQFVFYEWCNSSMHEHCLNFKFMFFVNFDLKIASYKVRKFIFDILASNPIVPFNISTPNIFDSHCEYFNFRNHEYKYPFSKIPVIRRLTGIKDTKYVIGFEAIYKLHLFSKVKLDYTYVYGL